MANLTDKLRTKRSNHKKTVNNTFILTNYRKVPKSSHGRTGVEILFFCLFELISAL